MIIDELLAQLAYLIFFFFFYLSYFFFFFFQAEDGIRDRFT